MRLFGDRLAPGPFRDGSVDFLVPDWPSSPAWLYPADQGRGIGVDGYAQRWPGVSAARFVIAGLAFTGRAAARRRRGGR